MILLYTENGTILEVFKYHVLRTREVEVILHAFLTWTLDQVCPTSCPTICAVRPSATFVNHMHCNNHAIVQEVSYTTYCCMRPANKPTVTDVAFCREGLDSPALDGGEWLVLGCIITG